MAEYFQRTRLVRLEKLRNRTPEERAILNEHKRQLWLAADQETRDHVHRQSAQWRKDHPEEYRAAQRRYSTSPKGRAAKRRSLLERFNLTQEQYDAAKQAFEEIKGEVNETFGEAKASGLVKPKPKKSRRK